MKYFTLNRNLAHLALLQRIELADNKLKKIRKMFGRYLFSKVFSKYFINIKEISENYTRIMDEEFNTIKRFILDKKNFLSIGAGIGGLELFILKTVSNSRVSFIEKNYVSDKIKYGWDNSNREGYNDLNQLDHFLKTNEISKDRYQIFDFDYDFEIYSNYLKKIMNKDSILIFDTIRPRYFENIFEQVEIVKEDFKTVHKSKRIACRKFK